MAAVLCLAGVLAGCKPEEQEKGMFDGIEVVSFAYTPEDEPMQVRLRRSEDASLVDEMIALVEEAPFEVLGEAEADALWEELTESIGEVRTIFIIFSSEEHDPFDSSAAIVPEDDVRLIISPDGSAWLGYHGEDHAAAAGSFDFAELAAFIGEHQS
ncbi:MAG: hypothetical protein DBX60_05060 [Bacillota bacterium]|nr:MAG: hypothetical protein DBX60_05060 [Bacillota bacterium]